MKYLLTLFLVFHSCMFFFLAFPTTEFYLGKNDKNKRVNKKKKNKEQTDWENIILLTDELVHEKERYKNISEELDQTFQELSGY